MIRAILIASLSVGALAQNSPNGMATCQCLEALPSIEKVDCTYPWGVGGKCALTVGLVSNFTTYPGDYGLGCKIHEEVGSSSCYDLTKVPPEKKRLVAQADWCNSKWCYIDPCNCDAPDGTKSDYFPGELFFSYATCGAKNTYTAAESATNTVGNAECEATEKASDAHTLKLGLGLVLAAGSFLQ